jgi:hypothetical protein
MDKEGSNLTDISSNVSRTSKRDSGVSAGGVTSSGGHTRRAEKDKKEKKEKKSRMVIKAAGPIVRDRVRCAFSAWILLC